MKISSALISTYYKDGLIPLAQQLSKCGVTIYSTGGTQQYLETAGILCTSVESLTTYPSILGGRVKTLHPSVFGGILGRRENATDVQEMAEYGIPPIDLVIIDLYPFEETLAQTDNEAAIIEKIDIGGPSLLRAAAKNFAYVAVVASNNDYGYVINLLESQNGSTTLEQRKELAARAFKKVYEYDKAISEYFNKPNEREINKIPLRYGENPHQKAWFEGDMSKIFNQLHGKELSYNNLVDVDAALQLMYDLNNLPTEGIPYRFAIIKHTNVCGAAMSTTVQSAWEKALAGDPESAFGGVLVTNGEIDENTARLINELFFEVLIATNFTENAPNILKQKKNRILLLANFDVKNQPVQSKSILNGTLYQTSDEGDSHNWAQVGGRETSTEESASLAFANIIAKHLKSNAIALVNNGQLIGKGCGQTSRVDALQQAIVKARHHNLPLVGSVLASDAFFPFGDCVQIAHQAGIAAFIQPGGSIRDKESIEYCKENALPMVFTSVRHFKH